MDLTGTELLALLGRGESIETACRRAGIGRDQFDAWWTDECRRRLAVNDSSIPVSGLQDVVSIVRDRRGLPHISANNDQDLFFGFGYATAQDRLFQLDYMRRKAHGRLAEILGPEAVESDRLSRTLNLSGIAAAEWAWLPEETRQLLTAYTAGINAFIAASRDCRPIEFDLLEYAPDNWSEQDSLAIIGDFRWYLTGRFPVIVVPELVKRAVGDGPLYRAFLSGEVDDECILAPDEYVHRSAGDLGSSQGAGEGTPGSNNWVLSGQRTDTGRPTLASDPHVPYAAVSIWHEVHLQGGAFQVGGVALVGMPAVMIGRNQRTAWGITNNICSQRDLYQERTDPKHPDCFLYDGRWEPARRRVETIQVRNASPISHPVVSSRNGPLVDQLLPAGSRHTGPVSVRWLGFENCGWLPATLGINRADSVAAIREAVRPWRVPTFSVVCADVDGHIAYQCSGGIPLRRVRERGYRPGWEPDHQWDGLIPWEGMPHVVDPKRAFVSTANHRVATDDYPYPLSGTWVTGYRGRRIREQILAAGTMSRTDHQKLQLDVFSGRAATCVPLLLPLLRDQGHPACRRAIESLRRWDYHVRPGSVAAAVFNVFFVNWCRVIAAERLAADAVELVAASTGPLAVRLLSGEKIEWFRQRDCRTAVNEAFQATLDELTGRLGDDVSQWTWGRLHPLQQKHFLSSRGELGKLLDQPQVPIGGDGHTINSSSPDASYAAWLGAGFRMVADMSDPEAGWWSIEVGSTSGQPGSPHYGDQLSPWCDGELFYTSLKAPPAGPTLTLRPN